MLDGKMLRAATGTPMRRIARAKSPLADADPEPLTFANLTTKSLTRVSGLTRASTYNLRSVGGHAGEFCRLRTRPLARRGIVGVRDVEQELLHVPCAGRAALGAKSAVQADVLILHHHAAGLHRHGHVERLIGVRRRRHEARAQIGLV